MRYYQPSSRSCSPSSWEEARRSARELEDRAEATSSDSDRRAGRKRGAARSSDGRGCPKPAIAPLRRASRGVARARSSRTSWRGWRVLLARTFRELGRPMTGHDLALDAARKVFQRSSAPRRISPRSPTRNRCSRRGTATSTPTARARGVAAGSGGKDEQANRARARRERTNHRSTREQHLCEARREFESRSNGIRVRARPRPSGLVTTRGWNHPSGRRRVGHFNRCTAIAPRIRSPREPHRPPNALRLLAGDRPRGAPRAIGRHLDSHPRSGFGATADPASRRHRMRRGLLGACGPRVSPSSAAWWCPICPASVNQTRRRGSMPTTFAAWFGALVGATCEATPALVAHSLLGSLAARVAAEHDGLLRRLLVYGVARHRAPTGCRPGCIYAAIRFGCAPRRGTRSDSTAGPSSTSSRLAAMTTAGSRRGATTRCRGPGSRTSSGR